MTKIGQTVNREKNLFELAAWQEKFVVVGIDEVGRGCLAGPVVAAAVILPVNKDYYMLKDSKLMTARERQAAFLWISQHCSYGVGIVHHRIVDAYNIRQATFIAMKKAFLNLMVVAQQRPSAILVDAMPLNLSDTAFYDIPVHHFNFGEKRSSSIAAASIVAKVIRDAMVESLNATLPGYSWDKNKGYGTAAHTTAIQKHQHSIIHRVTFLKKFLQPQN